jgi:hypothetical protein
MQALVGAVAQPPLGTSSETVAAVCEPSYMLGYLQQGRFQAAPPTSNTTIALAASSGVNCVDLESVSPALVEKDWKTSADNPLGQRHPQHSPRVAAAEDRLYVIVWY